MILNKRSDVKATRQGGHILDIQTTTNLQQAQTNLQQVLIRLDQE